MASPPPRRVDARRRDPGRALRGRPGLRRWFAPAAAAAVVALAAVVRLLGVAEPERIYFDETYYVTDARSYLERGVEEERPAHPPLGKWVIAAGTAALGDRPLGWRAPGAALGAATAGLAVVAGRLVARRWWPGLLAGLLVGLDGLGVTSSRIAMLDSPLAWWVALAFVLLVVDHRRPALHRRAPSGWRLAAGAALGLAAATKWSGALALPAALAAAVATDLAGRRAAGGPRPRPEVLALRWLLPFAVVPAAAYLAAYGPWLASYPHTETARQRCAEGACGTGADDRLAGWWREQRELVAFHQRLEATHPDRSAAWRWPLLDEPVLMYLERCRAGATACPYGPDEERRILGLGSPALWWPAVVAVPALAVLALRRRWWGGAAAAGFALAQWVPWLLSPKPGYSFYLVPVVPLAALSVALACSALPPRVGRALAVAVAVAAVAAFAFWRPLYVGSVLDAEARELRALLPSWG